jgi:hypothetical protein
LDIADDVDGLPAGSEAFAGKTSRGHKNGLAGSLRTSDL